MKRINIGIDGLSQVTGGGFLQGHSILVCGAPGTGKTIFGLQFLYKGAQFENENGLFVCVEDKEERLKFYGEQFGWDIDTLQKQKKMDFLNVPVDQKGFMLVDAIAEKAKRINAKRIVIDSLSAISINAKMFNLPLKNQPDPTGTLKRKKILKTAGYTPFEDVLQFTYLFVDRISDLDATSIFLTDTDGGNTLTRDGVSEYACDGVIFLQLHDTSKNVMRTLSVKKMRGSNIIPGLNSLRFTKTGLEVGEFKAFY